MKIAKLKRTGYAHNLLVLALGSILVLGVLASLLVWNARRVGPHSNVSSSSDELFVFCASGLRYAMDQVAGDYEREYGQRIRIQYGGSNTLLSSLQVGRVGDLYLPGDDSYIQLARQKGLVVESIPLATMQPVVVFQKNATRQISSVKELLSPSLRLACGNPDASAIGRLTRRLLQETGDWEQFAAQVTVFKPTVNDVANDVKLGSVDVGIIWDSTAAQYSELTATHLPELDAGQASVSVGVLSSSRQPTAALRFARYLGACDRGLTVFADKKYSVVDGDVWKETPQMTFFAGSVNRRALAPIVEEFERREGVSINTIYNGCGILTGQMKSIIHSQASGFPDTYMACDVYYLDVVRDWFQDAVNVSDTAIVIVVQEGNPKGIAKLADLLNPGVRVAIGQPDQCTIGVLSRRLLEDEGLYEKLRETNVVTETATSALLVPAVTTGAADAVLAYRTDTLSESDKIDVVAIESRLAKAIQPFSIARSSQQKELARRLYQAIAKSRKSFESAGFHWRLDSDAANVPKEPSSDSSERP